MALLARQDDNGLRYAGGAFFALKGEHRDFLRATAGPSEDRAVADPCPSERNAQWIKPGLPSQFVTFAVEVFCATRLCRS
jgi:hypothetical protein